MPSSKVNQHARSLMVVSPNEAVAQTIAEAFPAFENNKITMSSDTLSSMNGHAVDKTFGHDVVIVETDPEDQRELVAMRDLLTQRADDTIFLALTRDDLPLSKTRELLDIGIDDVLPISIDRASLKSAVDGRTNAQRNAAEIVQASGFRRGKVIPVCQARGGAGATTVAVNLACALAKNRSTFFRKSAKNKVVLLDFDLQFGSANVLLDIEDNGGFLQLIEDGHEPDSRLIQSILQTHALGVDVLCAPVPIVPMQSVRPDLVEDMITQLQEDYDYVVVDLPRAVMDWVAPALRRAEELILVTDVSVPSVRQARRLIDLFREENVGLPIEIVVNRCKRPLIKSELVREAEKTLEMSFSHWIPDNSAVARKCADVGRPVVEMKPRSDLGKALSKLAAGVSSRGGTKGIKELGETRHV